MDTHFDKLFDIVVQIESNNNPYAVRYEEIYTLRIKDGDKALKRARKHVYAFPASLRAYLAFSVGRLQFMIYNLYFVDELYEYLKANNLLPVTIPFCVDEQVEKSMFELFLRERMARFYLKLKANALNESDFQTFGRIWNGKEEYGKKVFSAWAKGA